MPRPLEHNENHTEALSNTLATTHQRFFGEYKVCTFIIDNTTSTPLLMDGNAGPHTHTS